MVGWLLHTGFGSGLKNGVEAAVQYRLAAAQVLIIWFFLLAAVLRHLKALGRVWMVLSLVWAGCMSTVKA